MQEWHFWESDGYKEYKDEYGMHFSPKLAENESKEIYGEGYWTMEDIKGVIKEMKLSIPLGFTMCDLMYKLNSERAAHEKHELLNTPEKIFRYVWEDLEGEDYYCNKIFIDFLSYRMVHNNPIEWKDVM